MPTIRRCCIVGCHSNSRQNPQLQFFQFPKPENPFHKLWKQACYASLSRILPFKKPVVCALHFHPNNIGGKRLMSSAVPSLRLEVPSNLKAVEQAAMMEEIERSRKCAYINAVVYEWLVRANLNPQLRGSITHGMIKEKADTAKQIIGSTSFVADNRWLNRFRETHLTGFAQKLAANQLKPLGPSLWIPDIVQDLQHLFPPTSADRVAKLESMPEQYLDYMQQYGEFEEEDDQDSNLEHPYQEQKPNHYQQKQEQNNSDYDAYGQQPNYNYDDFYYERLNLPQSHFPSPQQQSPFPSPQQQSHYHSPPQRPVSQSPQHRPVSTSPPQQVSQLPQQQQSSSNRSSPYLNPSKRPRLQENGEDDVQSANGAPEGQIEDLAEMPELNQDNNSNSSSSHSASNNGSKNNNGIIASTALKTNGSVTSNGHTGTPSPKPMNGQTNGNSISSNQESTHSHKELNSYSQALEHLKALEDFALFKENFRAIGLISQLEVVLRKGDRVVNVLEE